MKHFGLVLSTFLFLQTISVHAENCYIFTYFRDNGQHGLYLASSHDGLKWTPLNEGKPYFPPKAGGCFG